MHVITIYIIKVHDLGTCDFGPFPRTSFHWISLIMFMVSKYYILSGDTWISGSASHTCSCTFLEARHPVAQFYIHGTVAAILWSDACMQMYSGDHALLPTHDNEMIASQCMQSTNHMARLLRSCGRMDRQEMWMHDACTDGLIELIDWPKRLRAWVACCVSLYIYIICDSSKFLFAKFKGWWSWWIDFMQFEDVGDIVFNF